MPLLANLLLSAMNALAAFFGRFMAMQVAVKFAAYTAWIALMVTFIGTVHVCLSSLYSLAGPLFSGGVGVSGWERWFFIGVGMFIPANAGAVVSCLASVWIGTSVYRIQSIGIHTYAH